QEGKRPLPEPLMKAIEKQSWFCRRLVRHTTKVSSQRSTTTANNSVPGIQTSSYHKSSTSAKSHSSLGTTGTVHSLSMNAVATTVISGTASNNFICMLTSATTTTCAARTATNWRVFVPAGDESNTDSDDKWDHHERQPL